MLYVSFTQYLVVETGLPDVQIQRGPERCR